MITDDDGNEQTLHIEWLESTYFVQENGVLKLKFLHSDEITKENSNLLLKNRYSLICQPLGFLQNWRLTEAEIDGFCHFWYNGIVD